MEMRPHRGFSCELRVDFDLNPRNDDGDDDGDGYYYYN